MKNKAYEEITQLLKLSLPIIFAQIAQTGMGFVDTIVAGKAGNNDLAAIAIGSSLWVPIFYTIIAILMAVSPQISYLYGAGKRKGIINTAHQGIWLSIVVGIIGLFAVRFSAIILGFMDIDQEVKNITEGYINAVSWGIPAIAIYQALRYYSEALNYTRIPMLISFGGLFLNIIFNNILVFGMFGFPAMGGVGCGWATAIVMWGMLLQMLLYTSLSSLYRRYYLYYRYSKPDFRIILDLLKLGIPIGISAFIEVSIFAVIALLIAPLGTDIVAGHQIALNFSSLAFMIPYSLAMGISVRVGQSLGRKDRLGAKFSSYIGLWMSVFLAFIVMILIMIFSRNIVSIYTADTKLIELASYLILFAAVYQIPDAFQISAAGALRGYKNTKTPMVVMFVSFWLIGLPLGYYLGYFGIDEPLGAAGFWIALVTSLTVAAILLNIKLYKVASVKNIL